MADTICHRGPDDGGEWVEENCGVALGFRRLAIVDLSPTGHQPMRSADGRFTILFNGEIYNYLALRAELATLGATFRGTSDTEVMLAAFQAWGLERAVSRFNGMFAFALWDSQQRTLHLVRDRLGIKPLYYAAMGATFLFGSELKTLRAHPAFTAELDRDALALYLRLAYIPAPRSIYQGVSKLIPGCILTIRPGSTPQITPYWSALQTIERSLTDPFTGSDAEAADLLENHLRCSIAQRMVADVPLGAFLSGGIDSSTIVALMQAQSGRPVRTFTIGFHEAGYNEAEEAKAIARHLGTDHTELYLTADEMRGVIPQLPQLYDEPFADVSQIPTYLVSRMARQHVTVSLSGDGGDELFGGYNRYAWLPRLWQRLASIPAFARRGGASLLRGIPPQAWKNIFRLVAPRLPNPADKVQKSAGILTASSPAALYLDMLSQWKNPNEVILGGAEPLTHLTDLSAWPRASFSEQMMALDLITYLPDDILAKVDRASMGASLEARAPFLDDHETFALAWRFPLSLKIRQGQGKWLLRQVLYRHVPPALLDRPKMGFSVPVDSWLRGPLRDWAETLLDETRLRREGYFNPLPIRQKWREHLSGTSNHQHPLWAILMFQAWLENLQMPTS